MKMGETLIEVLGPKRKIAVQFDNEIPRKARKLGEAIIESLNYTPSGSSVTASSIYCFMETSWKIRPMQSKTLSD